MIDDALGRPLANLRLSVTDRCNLRCQYCMPEQEYTWLPREDILHFEEIDRLVDVFLDLGVRKVRLTGGEPLLRKDVHVLIERLAAKARIDDLALTTNGVLLASMASSLKSAGLHRLTVSLDTLHRDRFVQLARYDELDRVVAGIDAAAPLFAGLKIDTVIIRGVNDDELVALVEFATLAAPRAGPGITSSPARRCSPSSPITTGASSRSATAARRRPIGFDCPMAPCSASSPRQPNRSVATAIAVA
jgi:cyclic pyranopterin phosphate synthase